MFLVSGLVKGCESEECEGLDTPDLFEHVGESFHCLVVHRFVEVSWECLQSYIIDMTDSSLSDLVEETHQDMETDWLSRVAESGDDLSHNSLLGGVLEDSQSSEVNHS